MAKSGKGPAFERQQCVELSLWWSEGRREDIFWRTAMSGGRATVRAKAGKQTSMQHGDVAATDPIGSPLIDLCTIELKRGYSNSSIQDVIDRTDLSAAQQYETWIYKAIMSQKAAGSHAWLIITRKDRRRAIILMPKYLYEDLFIEYLRGNTLRIQPPPSLFFFNAEIRQVKSKPKKPKGEERRKKTVPTKGKRKQIYGMLLDDFFKAISRKDIEALT